jgi:hypothetical protein
MHDAQLIKDMYSDFTKEEILKISKEFGLDHKLTDRAKVIIEDLLTLAEDKHMPTDKKSMSDLAFEFLAAAEVIDDDGEYISKSDEAEAPAETVEEAEEQEEEKKTPECYGLADGIDPSCQQCKIYDACLSKRVDNRPICYGKNFDSVSDECKMCIESETCSEIKSKE